MISSILQIVAAIGGVFALWYFRKTFARMGQVFVNWLQKFIDIAVAKQTEEDHKRRNDDVGRAREDEDKGA